MNTYAYVGGDPLMYYDPDGLDRWYGENSPAIVYTNMASGWTMFYDPFTGQSITLETSNTVASTAQPGAAGPYAGLVKYCQIGTLSTAFGTAKVYTDDSRLRWIHGGGTGLEDPFAPRQGWVPTLGCIRGQNEDVENLCKRIRAFQQQYPSRGILYRRD